VPSRLLVLFDNSLLLQHVNLHIILLRGVVHTDELVELLPALDFTSFIIASHCCSLERATRCIWTRIEAEVIISELSTLPLHIVDGGQVAEGAELGLMAQNLINISAIVAHSLPAVGPLAQQLLRLRFDVVGRLALLIDYSWLLAEAFLCLLGLRLH